VEDVEVGGEEVGEGLAAAGLRDGHAVVAPHHHRPGLGSRAIANVGKILKSTRSIMWYDPETVDLPGPGSGQTPDRRPFAQPSKYNFMFHYHSRKLWEFFGMWALVFSVNRITLQS